jgi:hypothetical protein
MPPEPAPTEAPAPAAAPSRVRHWLDRHAHRDSRTRHYLELLQAVASVLTLGGVVGLLWQVNEANTTARRAVSDQTVETTTQLTQLELDYPGIACALYPDGDTAFARLDRDHQVAVQFLILSTNAQERYWRQYREALLAEESWLAQDRWFRRGILTAAMYPAVWAENRAYHAPAFVTYVDDLVADEIRQRTAAGTPVAHTLAEVASTTTAPPRC